MRLRKTLLRIVSKKIRKIQLYFFPAAAKALMPSESDLRWRMVLQLSDILLIGNGTDAEQDQSETKKWPNSVIC